MKVVVVGDTFLDLDLDGRAQRLAPDAPVPVISDVVARQRPGGAGLAAAMLAHAGVDVLLVTALGDDDPGRHVRRLLSAAGVELRNVGAATTVQKSRIRAGDHCVARVDAGGNESHHGCIPAPVMGLIAGAPVLVADYGLGLARDRRLRAALRATSRPVVWDPHPNGPPPVDHVTLATPNDREAAARVHADSPLSFPMGAADAAAALRERWRARAVAVTCGVRGAVVAAGDRIPLAVPAPAPSPGDSCGAGDQFAAAALLALGAGALPSEAVRDAVAAASDYVHAGGVASYSTPRAATPNVTVATSGCFDLLHAGHVHALRAARALGDSLVVCLNSDASVRRLKGEGRPVVPAVDRRAVLESLAFVDEVVLFDDDTPERVLEQLRPDIFVKGGDYDAASLPESRVLARWGGRTVVVPYLDGRSTTRIVEEVRSVQW